MKLERQGLVETTGECRGEVGHCIIARQTPCSASSLDSRARVQHNANRLGVHTSVLARLDNYSAHRENRVIETLAVGTAGVS